MNIDSHFHVIPEPFFKESQPGGAIEGLASIEPSPNGGRPWMVLRDGERSPYFEEYSDVKKILADLDKMSLDLVALSVVPNVLLSSLPAEEAERAHRILNDAIAEIVRAHPDRFVGLAAVPLQDGKRAAAELERTVKDHKFRGVEIPSNVAGQNLDEPEFFPFFEKAQELDVLIFIHPTNVAGLDRMGRYYLRNFIGNPLDTTIAGASLIFGGVLDRLPNLKVLLAHGGGHLPYQLGRFDHGFRMRDESQVNIKRLPSEYAEMMYYDTITHSPQSLDFLVRRFGPDRVVIGTDYPFDMGYYRPTDFVDDLPATSETKAKIRGKTLAKLLKI